MPEKDEALKVAPHSDLRALVWLAHHYCLGAQRDCQSIHNPDVRAFLLQHSIARLPATTKFYRKDAKAAKFFLQKQMLCALGVACPRAFTGVAVQINLADRLNIFSSL